MRISLKFPLSALLQTAVAGEATGLQLREIARLLYTLALPLVRRNVLLGKLRLDILGLTETDVTHECIADLFRRDEDDRLVELCNYFSAQGVNIRNENDASLMSHLRRLVSVKVSNNIYRLHKESDPVLWRILRNIKAAVDKSRRVKLAEILSEPYLVPSACDQFIHIPGMDDGELENAVAVILRTLDPMPSFLEKLSDVICDKQNYRRIRLTSLAVLLKKYYEAFNRFTMEVENDAEEHLLDQDIQNSIRETCREISSELEPRYVSKGKVDREAFSHYMLAIEQILSDEFVDGRDDHAPYFEYLRRFEPEMVKAEYMAKHRSIFEYLAGLSKQRLKEKIKEWI